MPKIIALLAALTSLPLVVAQSAMADVPAELERLDNALDQAEAELDTWAEDDAYDSAQELFPLERRRALDSAQASSTGAVTIEEGGESIVLSDVPTGVWFAPFVQEMVNRRILSGYRDGEGKPTGLFGPADPVTVEQLAKMVVLAAQVDTTRCPSAPKNEAAIGRWSAPYFACAEHLAWQIFHDGSVQPDRPALRAEVVTTVLEAFNRELEPATGELFRDVSMTMPSRHAIETAARDGIVSGYSDGSGSPTGFFGPFDQVNRAETAKIITLGLRTYGL